MSRNPRDAWRVLEVRAAAAATVLRRLVGGIDEAASELLPLLRRAIDAADGPGRPLCAANRQVAAPSDPVAALWQATTTLREHRGDGHVAVLTSEGLDGCEAHVLFAMVNDVPRELYQRSRGWSDDEWFAAEERWRVRGAGRELHERIEARTDDLTAAPCAALSGEELTLGINVAGRVAGRITGSGLPIPLPQPDWTARPWDLSDHRARW